MPAGFGAGLADAKDGKGTAVTLTADEMWRFYSYFAHNVA
jgi:hypothetical protein